MISPGGPGSPSEASDRFDALLAAGRPLVLQQAHGRDTVPAPGGRWPVSVVLRPDPVWSRSVAPVVEAVVRRAGAQHFRTGAPDSVHVSVRSLEGYRPGVRADDLAVQRYRTAVDRATRRCGPVGLRVRGIVVTPTCVMACAEPVDDAATRFASTLADSLGPDGWYEADVDRDIWYLSLLHFTDDIDDPVGLIDWVERNRHRDLGVLRLWAAHLVCFAHVPPPAPRMRPVVLSQHRLSGPSVGTVPQPGSGDESATSAARA